MEYTVSIIIPYYCTPVEVFSKCMGSILSAGLSDVEIIVIDDGSPEKYWPIVDKYAEEMNTRIIRVANAGVSSARNRGIQEAKGKWILFADSDDYMNPSSLNEVVAYARNNEGDIVIFNGGSDDGEIHYNTTFLKQGINYAAKKEDRLSLMESALAVGIIPKGYIQYFSLGAPYCKLLRTDFLRQNHLQFDVNVKFAEDTLFSLNIYKDATDIRFFDIYLYFYVEYSQSVTRKYRPGLSKDMSVFFDKTYSFLKNNNIYVDLEYAYLLRAEFEITRAFFMEFFHQQNDDRDARKKYLEFIHQEPYRTALEKDYLPVGNIKTRVFRVLLKRGYGRSYRMLKTINRLSHRRK